MIRRSTETPPGRRLAVPVLAGILGLTGAAMAQTPEDDPGEPLPAGVERLLPRGGIPAIFEPVFVTAEDSRLPDDAWVLGVAVGGDARAYSLNLLNQHEVVNDRIGGVDLAAVW